MRDKVIGFLPVIVANQLRSNKANYYGHGT